MAEAIGLAILAEIGVASTTIIAGVTTAAVVGNVALIGGSFALSLVGQAILGDQQKVAAQQYSSRQPLPPRQRSYGLQKLAGPKVAYRSYNGAFFNAVYHGEGPYAGFDKWYLDSTDSALAANTLGGPVSALPWDGLVTIEARLGEADQTASSTLMLQPSWTTEYRLRGCCYTAWISYAPAESKFKKYYPKGSWSEVKAIIRTSKVRNPNDPAQTSNPATWVYSNISADCIRDFLVHPLWGLRLPENLLNDASWKAMSTRHASAVVNKAGASIPRYCLGGTYQLTDDPADTLASMLSTCDGELYLEVDGTVGIRGGAFPTPTVTITDPNILSMTIEEGSSQLAAFNQLKISYQSPAHDFQQVEGEAWDDLDAQNASGELLEEPFSRPWVQDFNQVRRLAKIFMAKRNPKIRITGMVTDMSAAPALFEESIRLVLTDFGIDMTFLVTRPVANLKQGTCTLDLTSITPDAYDFEPIAEEGTPPTLPDAQAGPASPPPPANLVATTVRRPVSGNINAAFLVLTADEPARADLSLIGRYRAVGDTAWIDMAADGDNRGRLISTVLSDVTAYEPQGAIASYNRRTQSNWTPVSPSTVTAVADPVAPSVPTYTSAALSGTTVTHTVKQSSSANARNIRLSRANGFGKVFADAALSVTEALNPNQADTLTDTISLGYITWWLTAQNGSGVSSPASDPKSLLYVTQPGNVTQFPNDLSNAVWVKTNVTAALSGTGPDGAAATMVSETTATGGHSIAYRSTGLTSGRKVRAVWGLKAAGRFNGRLDLIDTNGSAFARLLFDLTDGTVTTSTNSGGIFTATTASIVKVSADFYLVIFQATAATTAIESRLTFGNDAKVMSYAGDTTKGLLAWACSLAPVT